MTHYQQFVVNSLKKSFTADARHQLFASDDLEQTCAQVSQVMKPHQLSLKSKSLDARMHAAKFGRISFCRLAYGGDVAIDPDHLKDFYLVQTPVSGKAVIHSGNQYIHSDARCASVLSPGQSTSMLWYDDNDQVMVRIDKNLINNTLAAMHGVDEVKDTVFNLGFNWLNSPVWCNALLYLCHALETEQDLSNNALVTSQIEQLVAVSLLSSQPNHFGMVTNKGHTVLPRHVRYVKDYIDEHANEAISLATLAQEVGVSLRGLYLGFHQHCGISPMQYLKKVRLEKVHEALRQKNSGSVTEIALAWGFMHLGRFSIEYKQRYGESPSETLRKY